jgi:hypothetical protein
MDDELLHLMAHWFTGLFDGLEQIDPPSREILLRACGRGCAASFTARQFCEAWQESADLDGFLANLAARFPEARYECVGPRAIRARYVRCDCDLVTRGLVRTPLLCECSRYNLQTNFERALGTPVVVTPEASILGGDSWCSFIVTFETTTVS